MTGPVGVGAAVLVVVVGASVDVVMGATVVPVTVAGSMVALAGPGDVYGQISLPLAKE